MTIPNKICLYFQSIKNAGGAEKKLCELSNYLSRIGYEVHLVTLDEPNTISFYALDKNINWHSTYYGSKGNNLLFKLKKIAYFIRIFNKYSIDVLIGFVMSGDKTLYLAATIARVKIIVAERNSPIMYQHLFSKFTRYGIWIWMHLANKITIQNEGYLSLYPSSLVKRLYVIPNSVVIPEKIARPEIPDVNNRFRILAVQRLNFIQKRPDLILKAFSLISEKVPLWDLYMLGDGSDDEIGKFKNLIIEYGLADRVKIISAEINVAEYYLNSNLFVTATLWEGFPNALAEAMSFGLPAIVFGGIPGVSDFIDGGGWVVKSSGCSVDLSKTILEAINSPEKRALRGRIARKKMKSFPESLQMNRWKSVLKEINK